MPSPIPVSGVGNAASDPMSTLPSSPPQIYLNLLILEASLRSQYLTLRARRRQHTFFLLILTAWIACFFYALFLRPREDGRGVGGSVYWVVETAEKVGLMGGIVTGILFWGTGQWGRGIRWPRRWIAVANRGLRGINAKLVIIKGPWWKELFSTLAFLFPYSSFFPTTGSSYRYVDDLGETGRVAKHESSIRPASRHTVDGVHSTTALQEDVSPGGDYVKLLLLPKPFSAEFRENWEIYRTEYWEKENERRAMLRQLLRERGRRVAKQEGGWLWWTGWRGWKGSDARRLHQLQHRSQAVKEAKSRHRELPGSGSQSRGSSRSTTPTPDLEEKPTSERLRRGTGSGKLGASERRKKAKSSATNPRVSKLLPNEARSATSGNKSALSMTRAGSFQGASSGNESDQSIMAASDESFGRTRSRASSVQARPRTLGSNASAAEMSRGIGAGESLS
ncbi:MAG: hypothetical protein M1825_005622 [Sarcosagium campestre]|nr:MAG: hypothetical protein M1825_005622 [Sarcosagium campestre]